MYSWRGKDPDGHGAQIDMLIDRDDNTVSICEMKYSQDEYELTEQESEKIRRRGVLFARTMKSRKSIQNVLVSNYGMRHSKYSSVIHREVTLADLFRE